MLAKVYITLKKGVLDPQGKVVGHALSSLGFGGVEEVRMGKFLEIRLKGDNRERAVEEVEKMCRKILANPVIEDYRVEITS
jgi:phosphoribosylformylglycinamidine synthase